MTQQIQTHIRQIEDLLPASGTAGRFVLGIDGLSRSGKTTLADALKRRLSERGDSCVLLHIDDYITERRLRYGTGRGEGFEYYRLQWDAEQLERSLFAGLKTAPLLTLPRYDGDSDRSLDEPILLPEHGIILIEGVFLQRSQWREYYDAVVYLDCLRERRFERESESARRQRFKFVNRYWKGEELYLEAERPAERADLVLDAESSLGTS